MRLATMFQDVFPSLFRSPVTERYPFRRYPAPERLRSLLRWDRESCTGCGMCATDCPSQALEVFAFDKKAKRIVLRLHVDRCTFCGQCTFSCKQGSLALANDSWELASLDRKALRFDFGSTDDVRQVLAGVRPAKAAESSSG